MERGLHPFCTQRPGLCQSKVPPCPSILSHRLSALGRERPVFGRGDRPRGSHGEGTMRRGKHIGVSFASDDQIDMRQAASVRVKQSKSRQIVANAYAGALTTFAMRCGPPFTLSSPATLFADHTAPCREALGRMLLHPVGKLRRAHQARLHRDVSEIRGGDEPLVAISRRRQTAEHGDDLDHEKDSSLLWPMPLRLAVAPSCRLLTGSVGGKTLSYIARASRMRRTRSRSDLETNRKNSSILSLLALCPSFHASRRPDRDRAGCR